MTHHGDILETEEAEAMARAAVDRAAGTLQSFCADTFVTDALLSYISGRAPSLKSLQLSLCDEVSNEALAEAVKGFPQLEELEITFCSLNSNVCELVGRACPQLKSFRLNERWTILQRGFAAFEGMDDDTGALGIASSMPELRDLQLIGNNLTNTGLAAILDHCPRLESLDVRRCCNLQMDDALRSKCARIGNLRLPRDPISDFKYRAYLTISDDYPGGSDIEIDMYDDLLDVVTDDEDADFDDMDDYIDGVGSDADMAQFKNLTNQGR
ncbi:unnamed protein product [Triticum turgidum subsp. durum]|uniref:Uncharacterized protein n=1 Tax=Triticum turgidum subsp. durum TaxID=4567 RepID=A0A9R0PPE5_TRITD|nr:unnamed protein product [Triticum turgidum subsp. durum]